MKLNKYLGIFFTTGLFLLSTMILTTPVLADRSPASCSGSSLGIVLYVSPGEAQIGESVSYTVIVSNGPVVNGSIPCDASDITASLTTPDGINHPISLLRTTLTSGQRDTYTNVVSYIARAQDVTLGNILRATASDTGVIHQNDTNSQGGGFQGVNVTVVSPPVVPPASSPSPSSSPSSSPYITPSPSLTPSPTPQGIIIRRTTIVLPSSGSVATPTPTPTPPTGGGGGGGSYVPSPTVVASSTPIIILAPHFPNTGFYSAGGNGLWDIVIQIVALLAILSLLIEVQKVIKA